MYRVQITQNQYRIADTMERIKENEHLPGDISLPKRGQEVCT